MKIQQLVDILQKRIEETPDAMVILSFDEYVIKWIPILVPKISSHYTLRIGVI